MVVHDFGALGLSKDSTHAALLLAFKSRQYQDDYAMRISDIGCKTVFH